MASPKRDSPVAMSKEETNAEDEYSPSNVTFSNLHPSHVLGAASLPLCIGAYVGYKQQMKKMLKEAAVAAAAASSEAINPNMISEGKVLAARALGIGTLLSCGVVGLVGAVSLYGSGYRSWNEPVADLKKWTPRKRRQMEEFFGIDMGWREQHPDFQATRNMSEDEELEYIWQKYFTDATEAPQETDASN